MKKFLSLLMALCLMLSVAAAESALPQVELPLDEKTELVDEQMVDGYGWMRQYSRETSMLYVMLMNAAVTADEMMGSLPTSNLQVTTLIQDEGGVKERKVYLSVTDNMGVDVTVLEKNGCSLVLMLMSEHATYTAGGQQALVDGWLEGLVIDGEAAVTDVAGAVAATETKLAAQQAEIDRQLQDGELVRIPKVGVSFGGEGVLVDEGGAEGAFMQTYQVGSHTVFVMAYLGDYLCDGVWQSIAFELPENTLITEDERGIRQRKSYVYGEHMGDVTVVWNNGCTIALVSVVTAEEYRSGMQDTITGWIDSLTINDVSVITKAE